MSHAEICPVCQGKGVIYGIAESGAYPSTKCQGCHGCGWVVIPDPPANIPQIYNKVKNED